MCGIAGVIRRGVGNIPIFEERLRVMVSHLKHRGPDDHGVWIDPEAGVGLGHCRLSILDLSTAGHQPMRTTCGRYVLVFNGEIYNHQDLRRELDGEGCGSAWRGHSDTETLLAGLRHWGVESCLKRLNGMFAFALWDVKEQRLILARDRMGEKPLYYGRIGEEFIFSSELNALTTHPNWDGEINRDALTLYMRYSYVPTPWSIYRGISKLPPSHYVVIQDGGRHITKPQCYWDLSEIVESEVMGPIASPEDLVDELDVLLRDAVQRRMMADVPLGAFLSGGYDSTTVAALMQAQSERPVKTFCIGFHEEAYNEAKHAKSVADHLGTEHTELYISSEEAMSIIPDLPIIYDEPFSDPSQIPTYLISRLAKQKVTVSLSGDGGDELFCGYNRYVLGYEIWHKLRKFPGVIRMILAQIIHHVPSDLLDVVQKRLPQRLRASNLPERLPKLADALTYTDGESFYRSLVSHCKQPDKMVLDATEPATMLSRQAESPKHLDMRERMMYLDMMTYLPDDILTKVDRASMAVSLEARVPLLDHRVVEFAWRVPTEYKYRDGKGKWLLRQVLYRYVPRQLMDRPKMGFSVPIEHWLRGPLRDWAESLLDENRLQREGYLQPAPIRQMWHEYISGKRGGHYCLWNVLMFQAWLEEAQARL